MAKWGEVIKWVELKKLDRATGEVISMYRYTVTTAKGNTFTHDVDAATAQSPELETILAAKAAALDRLIK